MADEVKEIKKEEFKPAPVKTVDKKKFIARKLKDINNMTDKAKAKALAERVLRNK